MNKLDINVYSFPKHHMEQEKKEVPKNKVSRIDDKDMNRKIEL